MESLIGRLWFCLGGIAGRPVSALIIPPVVLQNWSIMRTATARDLRNRYTSLLTWIRTGEEIVITQRGRRIARLVPEQEPTVRNVNWAKSPAVRREQTGLHVPTATEAREIRHETGGKW